MYVHSPFLKLKLISSIKLKFQPLVFVPLVFVFIRTYVFMCARSYVRTYVHFSSLHTYVSRLPVCGCVYSTCTYVQYKCAHTYTVRMHCVYMYVYTYICVFLAHSLLQLVVLGSGWSTSGLNCQRKDLLWFRGVYICVYVVCWYSYF